jgi:hypothetical protein
VLALTLAAVVLSGPLEVVPSGWTHISDCSTSDRVAGAYYEASSGSYVRYSISSRWPREDRRTWQPSGTLHDGTVVVERGTDDAVGRRREHMERMLGLSYADARAQGVMMLPMPPTGSREMEWEFERDGAVWHFSTLYCAAPEVDAAKALFRHPSARFRMPEKADGAQRCRRAITVRDFEALHDKSVDDALARLGMPSRSWPHECGGVAVEWPLVIQGSDRGYDAVFARDGDGRQRHWIEGPFGKIVK